MKHEINVRREKRSLGHPEAAALIKKAFRKALAEEGIDEPCLIEVLLSDDEGIRRVNREQRGIDRATDVLSFPFNDLQPGAFSSDGCERDPESGKLLLGDVMISLQRCEAQGEEYGHGFPRELSYLSVHSLLHLLGYDHTDEGEMKRLMRQREKIIMGDELS